ncbi:MAG TPA: multiheme c-type cytochrome, partial [Geobacteraceae bacterium]|nr:multiheme c-type cytochrome [Geobacteraceae bacterium]
MRLRQVPAVLAGTLLLIQTAAALGEECIPCHREKTPAAVLQWEKTAHGMAGIGCEKCHGTDHEKMKRGEARVDMKACAPCHKKAFDSHRKSRHGMGLH